VIEPNADDVLAAIIDTFDRYLMPEIHDEYAASLALTVSQMLRSVRARVAHEGAALWEDNAELRALLVQIAPALPPTSSAGPTIATALAARVGPDVYPSVALLQAQATPLRAALVEAISALADPDDPARVAIRRYLADHLRRQEPWLVHAFTGPRR
jgi:hypothetical protein